MFLPERAEMSNLRNKAIIYLALSSLALIIIVYFSPVTWGLRAPRNYDECQDAKYFLPEHRDSTQGTNRRVDGRGVQIDSFESPGFLNTSCHYKGKSYKLGEPRGL